MLAKSQGDWRNGLPSSLVQSYEKNSKIGKVVRGTADLRCSVYPGAHILNPRKLNFWFRYINFASTFDFRRDFDPTCHSSRDLETVRFWTICPSYFKIVNYSNRQLLSSHTHIAQATQAKNSLDPAWQLKDQPPNIFSPQSKKELRLVTIETPAT